MTALRRLAIVLAMLAAAAVSVRGQENSAAGRIKVASGAAFVVREGKSIPAQIGQVVFEADAGPLSGLKLIGFSVWERRDGGRNVTFPARQYSVNGERRSFALLRPSGEDRGAQEAIRECILDAYNRIEAAS